MLQDKFGIQLQPETGTAGNGHNTLITFQARGWTFVRDVTVESFEFMEGSGIGKFGTSQIKNHLIVLTPLHMLSYLKLHI